MAYRSAFAERDTANQALKIKVGNDYYDFLKDISLNDESLLADKGYREFINRFEFMPPLREVQNDAYEKSFSLLLQTKRDRTFRTGNRMGKRLIKPKNI